MNRLVGWIYERSPTVVQNLTLTAYSALLHRQRYMGEYPRYVELFDRLQWLSREEIEAYQDKRLARLVRYAYESVPYYRELFDQRGLKPGDVRVQQDLIKLPMLTRKDIKTRFDDLVSRDCVSGRILRGHTSGTTGAPLEIGYDSAVVHATYAALDRQYRWAGCRLARGGDRIAVFRGNVIVPLDRKRPPFWRRNYLHNQLLFSSFHLSPSNLPHYVREMDRFRPEVVDGYPSTLYVLARFLERSGRVFPVKAAISSSETLYDFQREAIERAFQCKIFDYYALAERTVFAAECEQHDGHHLCSDYGITEILALDYLPAPPGGSGRLVTTGLHNLAMPLIRYETNDLTAPRPGPCSCGRQFPLMDDVTTKAEDTLTLRDGRLISPSVLTHPFKPLNSIEESQIIQKDYDHIQIKIVPGDEFSDSDLESLITEMKMRIGTDTRVEVAIVDEIPRSRSGKFRWVISEVPLGL